MSDMADEVRRMIQETPALPKAIIRTSRQCPRVVKQYMTDGSEIVWMPRWLYDTVPVKAIDTEPLNLLGRTAGMPVYHDEEVGHAGPEGGG